MKKETVHRFEKGESLKKKCASRCEEVRTQIGRRMHKGESGAAVCVSVYKGRKIRAGDRSDAEKFSLTAHGRERRDKEQFKLKSLDRRHFKEGCAMQRSRKKRWKITEDL